MSQDKKPVCRQAGLVIAGLSLGFLTMRHKEKVKLYAAINIIVSINGLI